MLSKKINKIVLILSSIVVLIGGGFYLNYLWDYNVNISSQYSVKIAEIAKRKFSTDQIKKLDIALSDINKKEYQDIKADLSNIVKTENKARFSYIYVKKNNKLFFLADSEPDNSKDYSPPGQEYFDAGDEYYTPFVDNKSIITKPSTDRWGTWVSVLVPIEDMVSGEVIAVFALDYPASNWNDQALFITSTVAIIILILLILLFFIYIIINSNIKRIESETKYRFLFNFLEDAVMTLNPPSWNFTDGNRATLKIFGLDSIDDLKKAKPHDLSPEYQPDGELSINKAKKMINNAIDKGSISFDWVHKKKNGPEFFAKVSLIKVEMNGEIFLQAVVRDVTEHKKSQELVDKSIEDTKKALENTEKANKLMVGRELEMIKLKKEIAELKKKS